MAALALLGACSGAPSGFDAVPATREHLQRDACPELRGTFAIAHTRAGSAVDPQGPPDTHGLPALITFTQDATQALAWWVVPRAELLAFATRLRNTTPARYARWRERLFAEHPPLRPYADAYRASVAELGPPGPLAIGAVHGRCRDHWMLASVGTEFAHVAKDGTYSLSHETWLAHDATGALLVRHLAYKIGTIPIPAAWRRARSTEYLRYEPLPFEPPTPLAAAQLPSLLLCAQRDTRIAQFAQQLAGVLPPGYTLSRFAPRPATAEDAASYCPGIVIDIDIAGREFTGLSHIERVLPADDGVESITVVSMTPDDHGGFVRALRVVVH